MKLGCPPFSSPNPETNKLRPLGDATGGSEEHHDYSAAVDDAEKKAADWKAEVEAATDQDSLDAVAQAYNASGADYKSVDEAIKSKQKEIDGN